MRGMSLRTSFRPTVESADASTVTSHPAAFRRSPAHPKKLTLGSWRCTASANHAAYRSPDASPAEIKMSDTRPLYRGVVCPVAVVRTIRGSEWVRRRRHSRADPLPRMVLTQRRGGLARLTSYKDESARRRSRACGVDTGGAGKSICVDF